MDNVREGNFNDASNEGNGCPQCGVLVCGLCKVRVRFVYGSCMVCVTDSLTSNTLELRKA